MSADTAAPVALTVHALLDGWPVDLAFDLPPARLGAALDRLAELGYAPRQDAPARPAARCTAWPRSKSLSASRAPTSAPPRWAMEATAKSARSDARICAPRQWAGGPPPTEAPQ
ncbi:MAG: hypothetical protein WCI67_18765 [Chloroflexales bacterium]